jgi:hypothetical protein
VARIPEKNNKKTNKVAQKDARHKTSTKRGGKLSAQEPGERWWWWWW